MIYMYALPKALPQRRKIQLAGVVAYLNHMTVKLQITPSVNKPWAGVRRPY